jgi:DNA-binding CsgD family transcriptional regulator
VNVDAGILDRFGRPMMLIGADRSIRYRNGAMARILSEGEVVEARGGRLHCRTAADDRGLARALEAIVLPGFVGDCPGVPPAYRFLTVRSIRDGDAVGLSLTAVRASASEPHAGAEDLALLTLYDVRAPHRIDASAVAAVFDLTPAEAGVAAALAEGRSPFEIAASRRISITTVRSQLRALLGKTGTRRQTDLVSRLLSLPRA